MASRLFLSQKLVTFSRLMALIAAMLLAACDVRTPEYPARGQKKFTEVTISADGKLLAVLENTGTAQAKLLTRRIDQDTSSWQELPLPVFTSSARFGLEGQALLLTHDLPENDDMRQLTRWDLADLQKNSEVIYQGPFLAFPIEARPGEYLVRSCQPKNYPKSDVNSCRQRSAFGTYWMLVRDQNTPPVRLTPDDVKLTFSQPSVTPQGFFWVTENIKERGDFSKGKFGSPGMLSSFPLPNGKAPTLSEDVVKTSTDVVCDRGMVRCIRQYNAGTDRKTLKFIYRLEVVLGTQRCPLDDLIGYGGLVSFTPDGSAAVAPLPPTDTLPRRVAVIHFAPERCEPLSIQQFNIEEK
jgi:hypothetical protein